MKRNKTLKAVILVLALVMSLSVFAACTKTEEATEPDQTTEKTEEVQDTTAPEPTEEMKSTTPLVVGYPEFNEKFSTFFAESGYDQDAVDLVMEPLLTLDRLGGIVYNAIEGEVIPYNGVDYTYTGIADVEIIQDEANDLTTYRWTLRDDVMFSDGEVMNADDVIFSYYVLSDPSYDGSSTLYSLPIVGIGNYRTQTSDEVYAKYADMFDSIYAAGRDHVWSEGDAWTAELQDSVWAGIDKIWLDEMQAIVVECTTTYAAYMADYAGVTEEDIADGAPNAEGAKVAAGMGVWGFASYADGVLTGGSTGTTWTYANGEYPTLEDYLTEAKAKYGDCVSFTAAGESATGIDIYADAKSTFIKTEGPKDPSMGEGGVPNIAGIKKVSDTVVEVTTEGFDATAIFKLGIQVAPLHYYGDEAMYDYDNNMFGFPFGDLSSVRAVTTQPLGCGAYRLVKFENKIVYFEANENYYKGEPKTYYLQFKETDDADKIPGVATGTIDISDPSFGTSEVEEIKGYNSNGEVTGDVITTITVDNNGYGYIGMNASLVNVGGENGSDASKNLRKAIATVLSAYRSLSIDTFYGERASVINYPISNTSWAAPQKSDEGYKTAFSTKLDGTDIYTSDMTSEDKYAAALEAAKEYLIAAGYTFDEAAGKFVAAPEGAKLEYEMGIGGDGAGDHPSFLLMTKAKEAFEAIGITLTINDFTDWSQLLDRMSAGTIEIWAAAWGGAIDPDMYQVYHSSNVIGGAGTGDNHYFVEDETLDGLIMEARTSADQSFRKAVYKECLDIIIDWAVEIPIYQRQNCIIFSTERVNMDTVTPDMTTFWGWGNDLELLEMNASE